MIKKYKKKPKGLIKELTKHIHDTYLLYLPSLLLITLSHL